jgi:hypothetical protein
MSPPTHVNQIHKAVIVAGMEGACADSPLCDAGDRIPNEKMRVIDLDK